MLLIEPISAITSWEDYEYQGKEYFQGHKGNY